MESKPMLFAIANRSTAISPLNSGVTRTWLERVAAAVALQLNRDLSAWWGGSYGVRVIGNGDTLSPGEVLFCIVDTLPEPGAIAYHDIDGHAVPIGFQALSMCRTLDDVSQAISHEFCETAGDPGCNRYCDDGNGYEWAQELCDADENRGYVIDGIVLSNFLLPSFFVTHGEAPYSYLGTIGEADLAAPFATNPSGYQVRREVGGGETQVLGTPAAHRAHRLSHWSTRIARRATVTKDSYQRIKAHKDVTGKATPAAKRK